MRASVIGTGLIGKERIRALKNLGVEEIISYDPSPGEVTGHFVARSFDEILNSDSDWYFVATPHDVAPKIVKQLIPTGGRILTEKPLAMSLFEALEIAALSNTDDQVYVGFNYRFFNGVAALIGDMNEGTFGKIISVGITFGFGGSPKDLDSWKMCPEKVGSGCLLDPGIHILDLLGQMEPLNNLRPIFGRSWDGFWQRGINEEVHLLLASGDTTVNLQVSLVKWASTFRIEVNGTEGYGIVEGRGKSYGDQTYRKGKRWGWQDGGSQRDSEIVSSSDCDGSFYRETDSLIKNRCLYRARPCNLAEAVSTMKLYQRCLGILP